LRGNPRRGEITKKAGKDGGVNSARVNEAVRTVLGSRGGGPVFLEDRELVRGAQSLKTWQDREDLGLLDVKIPSEKKPN